jgi:transglutaminase-like putative cysteine protease
VKEPDLSLRLIFASVLAAAAFALPALASDKPLYGPPPGWVDVVQIPAPPPQDGAPAIQLLLDDHQSRLDRSGDVTYSRRAFKVLKPEGLASVKSTSIIWSPDTETVTFHTLSIIRDGKAIDLLQGGKDMLVLRREANLEQASLDGRLTASRQIDGLQVGDILDFAYTRVHNDPVVQGHSFDAQRLGFTGVAGRYRVVISWPKGDPVQWKTTAGFDDPKITEKAGRVTLSLDKTDILAPKAPIAAPLRFRRVGLIEVSSFKTWEEVSSLMAPLFEKASQLQPGSPIKAEAEAIAARTTDPKARAFAALQLVEDKTRYFFLGMGEGGYVPAQADDTWARRFGDCKAKTALLLAILRDLKVDAEPVLVNLGAGDGVDELPPSLAAFNHVIVRVKIADKSYWLDGTRTGDTNPQAMQPPPHRWGLPLRAEGAGLEKIVETQINVPTVDSYLRLDASKGLDARAGAHMVITMSGIAATSMRATAARASRADFERAVRQQYSNIAGGFDIDEVTWKDEPGPDRFTIEMTGQTDIDWRTNPDLGMLEYRVASASAAPRLYPKREPGPNRDAPYAVSYPSFTRSRTEIVLPDAGKGYSVRGPNGTDDVGGYEIVSASVLEGGVARFTVNQKALTPEISSADAMAADVAIRKLRGVDSLVRAPTSSVPVAAGSAGAALRF